MATGGDSTILKILEADDGDEDYTLALDPTLQGYCHEFVDILRAEDHCQICLLVLRSPVQITRCGHSFCEECLACWEQKCVMEQKDVLRCPFDKHAIRKDQIFKDMTHERMIKDLKVYCDNKEHGCPIIVKLGELQEHLNRCMCRMETCPRLCGLKLVFWSMENHSMECIRRPYHCLYCEEKDIEMREAAHHDDVCPMKACDCDYCNMSILRKKMRHHLDHVCPEFPTFCSLAPLGCTAKIKRNELEVHHREFVNEHMRLLNLMVLRVATTAGVQKQVFDHDLYIHSPLLSPTLELPFEYRMNESDDCPIRLPSWEGSLQEEIRELKRENGLLKNMARHNSDRLDSEIKDVKDQLQRHEISLIRKNVTICPFQWQVRLMNGMKNMTIPFYTKYMYKMNLVVGWTRSNVLKFKCFLLKGEYDNGLLWPYPGGENLSVAEVDNGRVLNFDGNVRSFDSKPRPRKKSGSLVFRAVAYITDLSKKTITVNVTVNTHSECTMYDSEAVYSPDMIYAQ